MISIIIPVFNEQKRLEASMDRIFSFIGKNPSKYEVIVVDDGSNDSTHKLLLSLQEKYHIRIMTHKKNLGKGEAIKTGVNSASGDLVIFTDIDLSVPIEFIETFVNLLTEDTDVLIGTRVAKDSKIERKQFFLREFLGGGFTIFANLFLGVGVSDFTCGFKLFRKRAAQTVFARQMIKRWAFDAESLYLAKKYGFSIKEVPVRWQHNKGSKVKFPQDIIETFVNLLQIRFNDLMGKYD